MIIRTFIFTFLSISFVMASDHLPLPRFASFKSDLTNLRVGPGENFPITDVYKRKNFPVQIIAEFQDWRRIKDFEGTVGWVHKRMLKGKQFCLTIKEGILYSKPTETAAKKAKFQKHIIAEVKKCEEDFCRIIFSSPHIEGWVLKDNVWGI